MTYVNVDFPEGLNDSLEGVVEEDERFKSKSEAVRYYVRNGLQREMIEGHRLAGAEPRTNDAGDIEDTL